MTYCEMKKIVDSIFLRPDLTSHCYVCIDSHYIDCIVSHCCIVLIVYGKRMVQMVYPPGFDLIVYVANQCLGVYRKRLLLSGLESFLITTSGGSKGTSGAKTHSRSKHYHPWAEGVKAPQQWHHDLGVTAFTDRADGPCCDSFFAYTGT